MLQVPCRSTITMPNMAVCLRENASGANITIPFAPGHIPKSGIRCKQDCKSRQEPIEYQLLAVFLSLFPDQRDSRPFRQPVHSRSRSGESRSHLDEGIQGVEIEVGPDLAVR